MSEEETIVEVEERYDLDGNLIRLKVNGVELEIPEPTPKVVIFNREKLEREGAVYVGQRRRFHRKEIENHPTYKKGLQNY